MENQPETCKSFGAVGIILKRGLKQHQRCVEASALAMQLPEAVQGIEIFRVILQDGVVEPLRLGQFAVLMRAQRAPEKA
jgi:hypothetical protein